MHAPGKIYSLSTINGRLLPLLLTIDQKIVLTGAIFGPVLGVWFGFISLENIDTGVAATLMSFSLIMIFLLDF